MGPQLHETMMGRKLIEHTLPEIAEQLKRVADAMEQQKLNAAIQFIELLEALTTDKDTANRIRKYMEQEGIWPSKNQTL